MIQSPDTVANNCSNWIGWKMPVPHSWNLKHQDMIDLATLCYNYLTETGATDVLFTDVGCCIGNTTAILADYATQVGGGVVSVDIFADRPNWPGNETKQCWIQNMTGLGFIDDILLKHQPSIEVAQTIHDEVLDLVYIDASHFYTDIKADILAWWPKVKPGGYISGHDCEMNPRPEQLTEIKKEPYWDTDDCTKHGHAGVIVATKEFFGDKLQQKNHTWWAKK